MADSDEEEPIAGITANLNSTLSTEAMTPEEEEERAKALASAAAKSRAGAGQMTAEQIALARKERKAAAGQKKGGQKAKGSDDDSETEDLGNNRQGKNMKLADLGAPKEMSRRERYVRLTEL